MQINLKYKISIIFLMPLHFWVIVGYNFNFNPAVWNPKFNV